MEPYWDVIEKIINESDIVLEVLDARLIELSRNEKVEELIQEAGRPIIFVVNKADLVSKEGLKEQVKELKKVGSLALTSIKHKGSTKVLLQVIKDAFNKYGKSEKQQRMFIKKDKYREAQGDIVVGVLGYPNTGKSSIINSLANKRKVKVSKKAGTTHGVHWVKATDEVKLIDSPGVIPLRKEDEVRYGLIGARNADKLKNPEVVAYAIINLFYKNNKKAFEKFYKIKLSKDPELTILNLAKKKSYLLRGGKPDEHRTIMDLIKDWQFGKLKL